MPIKKICGNCGYSWYNSVPGAIAKTLLTAAVSIAVMRSKGGSYIDGAKARDDWQSCPQCGHPHYRVEWESSPEKQKPEYEAKQVEYEQDADGCRDPYYRVKGGKKQVEQKSKFSNSWDNPYAVGCLAIFLVFFVTILIIGKCSGTEKTETAKPEQTQTAKPEQRIETKQAEPKYLFQSLDDFKNRFNKAAETAEKAGKKDGMALKLARIKNANAFESGFFVANLNSKLKILKELSIGGITNNGRIYTVAIKGVVENHYLGNENQIESFGLDFVPNVIAFIMSVDTSLSVEGADSVFGKMSNNTRNFFNGEISENGYRYEYAMAVDEKDKSATIITIAATAEM
jgi:hypothetical protein